MMPWQLTEDDIEITCIMGEEVMNEDEVSGLFSEMLDKLDESDMSKKQIWVIKDSLLGGSKDLDVTEFDDWVKVSKKLW